MPVTDPLSSGWQRGDLSIEDAGARVWLRHRGLPVGAVPATIVSRSSLVFAVLDYLVEPRSDDELAERFPGPDLVSALRILSERGLIFRGQESEKSYLLRRLAIYLLQTAESLAHDVLGFGPALFDDRRRAQGGMVGDCLNQAARLIAEVQEALVAERASYLAEQCSRPIVRDHFGSLQLNLGSGRRHLPGWIGIDVQQAELRLNLRWGLPFPDASARYVYSAHLLEHLHHEDAKTLLADIRRVLRHDGVLRLVVPDIGACIAAYSRDDRSFFEQRKDFWPDTSPGATPLEQILTYAGANALPGDLGAHKFGYDFETLQGLLQGAGFSSVERSTFNGSRHEELRIDNTSAVAGFVIDGTFLSLFVEAAP